MSETIIINKLPTRTWNRLGVNETSLVWGDGDDLGTEQITAAGQTERLEISGSAEYSEKTINIHAPEGQTVTVFETLKAEKSLLVARRSGSKGTHGCAWYKFKIRRRIPFSVWKRAASALKTVRWS